MALGILVISKTSKFTCNFSFCVRMMSLILNRKQKSRGDYTFTSSLISFTNKPLYQNLNYIILLHSDWYIFSHNSNGKTL